MVVFASPDERSDIRDSNRGCPGYRFAHPGYDLLRCLTGETWTTAATRASAYPWRECTSTGPRPCHCICPRLRSEIANFLGSVRGLVCSPEEVVVTSGTSGALDFCSRMILDPGDEVWIEEPGFVEARWALTAAGAKLVPVPVDDKGLVVSEGVRRAPRARLIVVTPSHQYPLGVSMGLERRLELLDWANKNDIWVIEDAAPLLTRIAACIGGASLNASSDPAKTLSC
ncbi:protein of unknown function [Bradyrhizobium vignae]|uniref:Aminotransferase class I/classII large domain-containing protein n=1 Tax=Bradyrhizobium vignae TaxID=1549949 RepID=A0A2U3Q4L9_9BRAD|nr:protein of unknown function [Bradyrhizobium vignae]